MSPTDFHILWTIVSLVTFVGIVVWAFSGKRKKQFEEAGRIPFDDDHPVDRARFRSEEKSDD